MVRVLIIGLILINSSLSSMAQTVSNMNDYAGLVEAGGPFPKEIDLEKMSKFYLTNDFLISVATKTDYQNNRVITLQMEDEQIVAKFIIDPENIEQSHPFSNPANEAFGPFTFSLKSPTDLIIDCTKFNVPHFLMLEQPANIVGLQVTFNSVLRAHFDDNSAKAFYQFTLSDGQEEKSLDIESGNIEIPVEWQNYVIRFQHGGGKGLFCTVSPKGMDRFPIHLPIFKGHVNPVLTIDSTVFQVSSYYSYPNPDNKEEELYGANLKINQTGYTPNDFIQFTDAQPQEAALAFGGYFWWLKQEDDILFIEKPKWDVPFSVSQIDQPFHFEEGYSLTYKGSTVVRYEFSEAISYAFELTNGKETETISFSSENKELGPIRSWKGIEVELVKMEGMKRVRVLVRKMK